MDGLVNKIEIKKEVPEFEFNDADINLPSTFSSVTCVKSEEVFSKSEAREEYTEIDEESALLHSKQLQHVSLLINYCNVWGF